MLPKRQSLWCKLIAGEGKTQNKQQLALLPNEPLRKNRILSLHNMTVQCSKYKIIKQDIGEVQLTLKKEDNNDTKVTQMQPLAKNV